jgi:C4-dicarboxylate transporter DctM subunit
MTIALLAIAILIALLLLEVPAYVAIGVVASVLLLLEGSSFPSLAQIILDHLNSSTLTALPFFVVAAAFLQRGGLAAALIDLAMALVGRFRGGLAYVTVVAGGAFSTLSGSSVATAMAMGKVLAPEMQRRGYPRNFSLGLIGTTGTLGILVPPSLAMILFGLLTGESILKLFLAGIIPGLIQIALLFATIAYAKVRIGLPVGETLPAAERRSAIKRGLPACALVIGLFSLIYLGLITVTEAAVATATFAIILSLVVYKGCTKGEVLHIIAEGLESSAKILMIVGSALLLSHWIASAGLAAGLLKVISDAGLEPWQFLILINLILLLMGIFLEGVSSILILVPLVAPLLAPLGIDPLHFAVIMVVNLEIGLLTPPIGLNIFVLSNIGNCSTADVIRGLIPFLGVMLVLLLIVTLFPALSTWLPNYVYG